MNLPVLKHLTRTVGILAAGLIETRSGELDIVITIGAHSPFQVGALVLSRIRKALPVAVLTDAINVPHAYEGTIVRRLKSVDGRLLVSLLRQFSGIVGLSPALADDVAPGVPGIVMPGIARLDAPDNTHAPEEVARANRVVYAGTLSAAYGLGALLEAHSLCPDYELHIFGAGPMEAEVAAASRSCEKIVFHGMVDRASVVEAYRRASLLVNPRPPDTRIARYSFPSKLMEFLASGTPTLTTDLPGLPEDIRRVVMITGPDPQSLANAIANALDMDENAREELGRQGRELMASAYSSGAQGRRLVGWLRSLMLNPQSHARV